MKKILVPTDFSTTAKYAYQYACKLAAQYPAAKIKVLHAYTPESEVDFPNIVPPVSELLEARKAMLENFLTQASPAEQTTLESKIVLGFAVEEIVAASEDFDLVVMGTTGENGILEKIFGSVSNNTCRRAACPVILVPNGHSYEGLDRILYASNYESAEDDMLEQLLAFNKAFNAKVHFVHVNEKAEESFSKGKDEIMEELFEEEDPKFSFEFEEIQAESIAEGLNDYAIDHKIDVVVMANKKRSWWERWFNPSATRAMAFATHTPLMVLHWED